MRVAEYRHTQQGIAAHATARAVAATLFNRLSAEHAEAKRRCFGGEIAAAAMPRWAKRIVMNVADQHGISPQALLVRGSPRPALALARFEAMYLLYAAKRHYPFVSLPVIGRWFGGRHHTSVLNGVRRHAEINGLPQLVGIA